MADDIDSAETYHVVATFDTEATILYVNGRVRDCRFRADAGGVQIPESDDKLYLGTVPGALGAFEGQLDELVIYDERLLAATVVRHWLCGQRPR